MPVDEMGNSADVIIYGGSTIKRSNFGRFYQHFFNACGRDLLYRLRRECGLEPMVKPTLQQLNQIGQNRALIESLYQTLKRYFAIVAPEHLSVLAEDDADPTRAVLAVLADEGQHGHGINTWIPTDTSRIPLDVGRDLWNSEFRPHYGPITYTNVAGERKTTVRPTLIAPLYMMNLEKFGDDWSGVASVKRQQLGLPAKSSANDANRTPGLERGVRSAGESETRSFNSTIEPNPTLRLLSLTNNPAWARMATHNLLAADEPSNLPTILSAEEMEIGDSRPNALFKHLLECRGIRLVYAPCQ